MRPARGRPGGGRPDREQRGGGTRPERAAGQRLTNSATVRNGRPFAPTGRGPRGVRREAEKARAPSSATARLAALRQRWESSLDYLWESAEGPDDGEEDYHAALSQALAALLEFERLAGELATELDVRRRA